MEGDGDMSNVTAARPRIFCGMRNFDNVYFAEYRMRKKLALPIAVYCAE